MQMYRLGHHYPKTLIAATKESPTVRRLRADGQGRYRTS